MGVSPGSPLKGFLQRSGSIAGYLEALGENFRRRERHWLTANTVSAPSIRVEEKPRQNIRGGVAGKIVQRLLAKTGQHRTVSGLSGENFRRKKVHGLIANTVSAPSIKLEEATAK